MGIVENVAFITLTETLEASIKASKYPMSTDTEQCTSQHTKTVDMLGGANPGTGHNNFLSGVIVQFDLTLTKQAWSQWQRYHFQQINSSQSTMHRLVRMDIDNQCINYVTQETKDRLKRYIAEYNAEPTQDNYLKVIYNAPTGLLLTARTTTNYLQLKTMYAQRKDHRLPEWRELCEWMETLPHAEWITGE